MILSESDWIMWCMEVPGPEVSRYFFKEGQGVWQHRSYTTGLENSFLEKHVLVNLSYSSG